MFRRWQSVIHPVIHFECLVRLERQAIIPIRHIWFFYDFTVECVL